jgi:hypothetical protein
MAEYKTNALGQRVLTPEETYQGRPNSRAKAIPKGDKCNNKPYRFYGFCSNDEKHINSRTFPITLFNGVWHLIRHDEILDKPILVKPQEYIHIYDTPTDKQIAEQATKNRKNKRNSYMSQYQKGTITERLG